MGSDNDDFGQANLSSRYEWHPEIVSRLLDSYAEKCSRGKGYLKMKDWEEIINYINIQYEGSKTAKTTKQCREKVDNLKRRYKVEKRKAEFRGWSHVEWSLYEKLDEIMHSLKRNGNDTAISDCHSFKLMEPLFFEEAFETDRNKHHSFMNNRNGIHGSSNEHNNNRFELITSKDKGRGLLESTDGLCDVVLNVVGYENGVELLEPQNCKQRKSSKGLGFDQSGANSQIPAASNGNNPVQALADALVGFSEVYSYKNFHEDESRARQRLRKRRRKNGSGGVSDFSSISVSSSYASSNSEEE